MSVIEIFRQLKRLAKEKGNHHQQNIHVQNPDVLSLLHPNAFPRKRQNDEQEKDGITFLPQPIGVPVVNNAIGEDECYTCRDYDLRAPACAAGEIRLGSIRCKCRHVYLLLFCTHIINNAPENGDVLPTWPSTDEID